MSGVIVLLPVFLFFAAILGIAVAVQKKAKKQDFINEYFIGGRRLGGFVLAMTLVATYSSVSSFSGGPGLAWQIGFGWVYYASIQVVTMFLVLGVLGKKIAIVGRKINAVTVIDIIRFRYGSEALANLSALITVVFFAATITAQFIGGANLFAAAAGISYGKGLALFALVVAASTAIGGFRGVAITDTLCALVMLLGIGVLTAALLNSGGGIEKIMEKISRQPELLEPTGGGKLPVPFLISQWLLCGFCTMGLPQSLVRNLGYRDSKSLHRAMIYGTVVIGAMMIGMHLIGVLARAVITEIPAGKTTDAIIPELIVHILPPALAGIAIIGPIAASMSTVSSLLIASSSAIIKDIWLSIRIRKHPYSASPAKTDAGSMLITFTIGLVCFAAALKPPSLIVWINLFSFGGLQSAFFWTFILGLFWKKANAPGAFLGMAGGAAVYCVCMVFKFTPGGMHQIVPGIVSSLVFFAAGSLAGKPPSKQVMDVFFP
ncbi:MAG: sodium/pantothenate symporter [Spirochaetaceae bacterium]|jgi:sodium/pantothenate symporter|nr:sodium/pantothenate symporter [Spirochaetaceae bacterium]